MRVPPGKNGGKRRAVSDAKCVENRLPQRLPVVQAHGPVVEAVVVSVAATPVILKAM